MKIENTVEVRMLCGGWLGVVFASSLEDTSADEERQGSSCLDRLLCELCWELRWELKDAVREREEESEGKCTALAGVGLSLNSASRTCGDATARTERSL